MADKKATIYIIDVGPTMWNVERKPGVIGLDLARKAVITMLEAKVIAGLKSDVTGLIVFGTDETKNHMYDQTGDYRNIITLYPIEQPNLSTLRTVQTKLPHGNVQGDAFDALIIALDMIDKHCKKLKYKKRIYMLTDGESPINDSDFTVVSSQINNSNVELNILGMDFDDPDIGFIEKNKTEVKQRSESFFRRIVNCCQQATIFSMEETLQQLSKPHLRPVRPVAVFKGPLMLNDPEAFPLTSLVINVEMYSRTTKARPLTSKKYSALAEASTNDKKTYEVNISRSYTISVIENDRNESVEVPHEDLNKSYSLGKTYVPVSEADEEIFTMSTIQSMSILCFVKAQEFKREYSMSNVLAVVPQTNCQIMAQRLSALIHALYEKDSYAVVRYVRKNNEPPKLGVLVPYIRAPKECLYFTRIPFKEDCSYFTFPSLERVIAKNGKELLNHSYLPTDEMLDKMDRFVDGMNLMDAITDEQGNIKEHLKVKDCFNPVIVRTKQAISHRALFPDEPLIPPDPEMFAQQTRVPPSLVHKNKDLADEMRSLLNIKKVKEKGKTGKRRFADANRPATKQLSLDEILNNAKVEELENGKKIKLDGDAIADTLIKQETIREVGTIDPVANFEAMIANREEDLVSTAVEQMSEIILYFVKTSFGEGLYPKALECLKILRNTCAKEDEASRFNDFLKDLKSTCFNAQPSKTDFWDLVVRKEITLISQEEAPDSTISSQEAREFLHEFGKETNIEMDQDNVATDDLLDMLAD